MFLRLACLEEVFSILKNLSWMIYEDLEDIEEKLIKSYKVEVFGQEVSTQEDNGQKFEFINEGVNTWN